MWARACERPARIPIGRPRARSKLLGLAYERNLAKALGGRAFYGKWFEFLDRNGPGWCQPDLIFARDRVIYVLECKYSWVPEGHSQIDELYKPVLELAFGVPVCGIVVCKSLAGPAGPPKGATVYGSLAAACGAGPWGPKRVWHWPDVGGKIDF